MTGVFTRTYQLTQILVISQLRANRNKNGKSGIWERPAFILVLNLLIIISSSAVAFQILTYLPAVEYGTLVAGVTQQVLAFVPIFSVLLVLLAGIMFEMNASSRFASSDLVNWLPLSRTEYVAASAFSVSYTYSPYLCLAEGVAFGLSIRTNLLWVWIASFALSMVSLMAGGVLIEILRASINRVYSAMSKKTGRGTLFLRLLLIVIIIVAFQAIFNPNLLFNMMSQLVGAMDASYFVPLVWPSLAILSLISGEILRSGIFAALTLVFVVALFALAIAIRSKYWAPIQSGVSFGNGKGYLPHNSRLLSLGFSPAESSIIAKDLKAYLRKKELVAFLAMPFVFAALIAIQKTTQVDAQTIPWFVAWFAGFAAVFISATSIGVEGKSILNMYFLPLIPKELVRAKAVLTLLLSVCGALAMSVVATALFETKFMFFSKVLAISIPVSIQSVFVGLAFAARDSDFVDRPRPRYVSTWGMLKAVILGFAALVCTSLPVLILFDSEPLVAAALELAVFFVITFFFYRYALAGAKQLMIEIRN